MLFIIKMLRNKIIRYAYVGWLVITLFYFYQYVLRIAPGIMIDDMRNSFNITAEQFASFGALYLLAYALLQIPLGITVDKIGVKKMCLYSIVVLTGSALLMANTETFWIAQISRFGMGAGSASAFMCALKFIADHTPPGNRGFLMGATLALGTGGAIIAGNLLKYFDSIFSWQHIIAMSAGMGIIIFILMATFIKSAKQDINTPLNNKNLSENLKDVLRIFCSFRILIYAILAVGLYTPLSALTDLWGAAFIKQKFGVDKYESAQLIMVLYIGLIVGSLVLPWFSEKYRHLNKAIIICSVGLLATFSLLIYIPFIGYFTLILLLFIIGFFCGAEMMCFTGALEDAQQYNSGHIIGVINTLNMLGGAVVQQTIGYMLDKGWDGAIDSYGIRQYSTQNYESALNILVFIIAVCCLCSFVLLALKFKKNKYF